MDVPHRLYRAMMRGADGQPLEEDSARGLGVREGFDVIPESDSSVLPRGGGMSVAPDDPRHLPTHRRPAEWGGTGRDPLWVIDEADLPADLRFRRDTRLHGLIEPSRRMTLEDFRMHLRSTGSSWESYS